MGRLRLARRVARIVKRSEFEKPRHSGSALRAESPDKADTTESRAQNQNANSQIPTRSTDACRTAERFRRC